MALTVFVRKRADGVDHGVDFLIAVEKGATAILMPVTSRKMLFDLSDEMATKVDIQFYLDARDALLKSLGE